MASRSALAEARFIDAASRSALVMVENSVHHQISISDDFRASLSKGMASLTVLLGEAEDR